MASLFTSQTPDSGNNSDGTPGITTATAVRFAVDGVVSAIRFFSTVTIGGTYTGLFYEVTAGDRDPGPGAGTLLASGPGGTPDSATWNEITLTTPGEVAVTAGTLYKAAVFSGDGRYVNTNSFPAFVAGGLTNGDITADADGTAVLGATLTQGSFQIDATPNYPRTSGTDACYFVDVVFTPDITTVNPDSLAVPVALGAPTVTYPLTVTPDGVSLPVALGPPFLHVIPDGVSIPIAFGAPQTEGAPAPSVRAGWESYGNALRFNADQARREQDTPPLSCPNDGEALEVLPDGRRHCPADGWVWPDRRIVNPVGVA